MKSNARITDAPSLLFDDAYIYWVIKEPIVYCVITSPDELAKAKTKGTGTARCRDTDMFDAIFGMKKSLERAASSFTKEERSELFRIFGNIYGFGECKPNIGTAEMIKRIFKTFSHPEIVQG